jgi:hypothetical protein
MPCHTEQQGVSRGPDSGAQCSVGGLGCTGSATGPNPPPSVYSSVPSGIRVCSCDAARAVSTAFPVHGVSPRVLSLAAGRAVLQGAVLQGAVMQGAVPPGGNAPAEWATGRSTA